MTRKKSYRNNERGSTLVEFAIGVTVFLMALFAVLEFGRALWTHNALTDAARRGARYAALHTAADVAKVQNVVVYGNESGTGQPLVNNLTTAQIDVAYNDFGLNDGTVTVSITEYEFEFVIPVLGTTITMPDYKTTLTAESAGLIPSNI